MLRQALLNTTYTENLAPTYRSTLDPVLDFYYHAPAKRGHKDEVVKLFEVAYRQDPMLTILALFNLRDVRGGKGERESFRACLAWLAKHDLQTFELIAPLIPEYGRWDDLLDFHESQRVRELVNKQLRADCASAHPSLLAKWMPSPKANSQKRRALARAWRKALGMSEREYRHTLSTLRKRLDIVERAMSAQRWGEIEYSHVPSRASIIYRRAFERHDKERYLSFIDQVKQGKAKINANTLHPYELVHAAYYNYDDVIQAAWNALPDYTEGKVGLVVADVSGSMTVQGLLPKTRACPIDVSISLAIYYAQKNKGPWANMAISFSAVPSVIELPSDLPLNQARRRMLEHEGLNTDLQAVFKLILRLAKEKNVSPEEMPSAVWVISDMEFDDPRLGTTNFEAIRQQYAEAGYPMPTLIFWNVASRNMQTPVTKDEQGVVLVSGFSASAFKAAMENKTITPYEAMLKELLSERYQPVLQALNLGASIDKGQSL